MSFKAVVDKKVFDWLAMPEELQEGLKEIHRDNISGNNSYINWYLDESDDSVDTAIDAWLRSHVTLDKYADVIILIHW